MRSLLSLHRSALCFALPLVALACGATDDGAVADSSLGRAPDTSAPSAALAPASGLPAAVTVRLLDGRTRRFVDQGEEETAVKHRDDGVLPHVPVHVVFREMWEAWDVVLIDLRTGDSVIVPASPVVSPTGRRLAVTSLDFDNGYAPTIVEVWRVDSAGLVLEWREETGQSYPANTGWGASDWTWEDDSTARIRRTVPVGEDGPHRSHPARLRLREGRWQLDSLGR